MTTQRLPFAHDADLPWEAAGEGIQRKVLTFQPGIMMVHFVFEAGAVGIVHSHPHVQCTYVASDRST